jgi:hypothetical protein
LLRFLFGYRIVPTLIPWMTTTDPCETHPASPQYSKALNGFVGILRASGMETTESFGHDVSEETMIQRKRLLIGPNEKQEGFL